MFRWYFLVCFFIKLLIDPNTTTQIYKLVTKRKEYTYKNKNYTRVEDLTHEQITKMLKDTYNEYKDDFDGFDDMVNKYATDDFCELPLCSTGLLRNGSHKSIKYKN